MRAFSRCFSMESRSSEKILFSTPISRMPPALCRPKSFYLFQAIGLLFINIVDILFHLIHAFEAFLPAEFLDRVVYLFTAVAAFAAGKEQASEKDKEQDNVFTPEVFQGHLVAVLIRQGGCRCSLAFLNFRGNSFPCLIFRSDRREKGHLNL